MRNLSTNGIFSVALVVTVATIGCFETTASDEDVASAQQAINPEKELKNKEARNFHMEEDVRFQPTQPGSDIDNGRAKFGVAADLVTLDDTDALFEGPSMLGGGNIVSNGRSCFTCHRGSDQNFGVPPPPIDATIDLSDPIFVGIEADAQGDPDAMDNLNNHGLFKYRPNRFNPQRDQSDPFRRVHTWRKSPSLYNVGFSHGFLLDARARVGFEAVRGAIFSHTQPADDRFDDILTTSDQTDMEAFIFSLVTDPQLNALRDPNDPMYDTLIDDPFYTVNAQTHAQKRGQKVFKKECMDCHNNPNVFNNISNVEALGTKNPITDPAFGPSVARTFNIGVAERNLHGLRFTEFTGSGFEPIVIPLVEADGTVTQHVVTSDLGLAASTARTEDIGRMKVPQLRNVSLYAPYFHDNSAATLEEAVDYHLSSHYKNSPDGKKHKIHVHHHERDDLIEFLKIL